MRYVKRQIEWQTKPQCGTPLRADEGTLTAGLACDYLLNELGSKVFDLVTGSSGSVAGCSWDQEGVVMGSTTATKLLIPFNKFPSEGTLYVRFRPRVTWASGKYLFDAQTSAGRWYAYCNGASTINVSIAGRTYSITTTLATTFPAGKLATLTFAWSTVTNTILCFANGRLIHTSTGAALTLPTPVGLSLGHYYGTTTSYIFQGAIDGFRVYETQHRADEVMEVTEKYWQTARPRVLRPLVKSGYPEGTKLRVQKRSHVHKPADTWTFHKDLVTFTLLDSQSLASDMDIVNGTRLDWASVAGLTTSPLGKVIPVTTYYNGLKISTATFGSSGVHKSFSFLAVFTPSVVPSDTAKRNIIGTGFNSSSSTPHVYLGAASGAANKLASSFGDGYGVYSTIYSPFSIEAGKRYVVLCCVALGVHRLYVNGALVAADDRRTFTAYGGLTACIGHGYPGFTTWSPAAGTYEAAGTFKGVLAHEDALRISSDPYSVLAPNIQRAPIFPAGSSSVRMVKVGNT